jgi:hypothetical protein
VTEDSNTYEYIAPEVKGDTITKPLSPAAPDTEVAAPVVATTVEVTPRQEITVERVEALLHAWFVEHVHNSPISRYGDALEHLKVRLSNLRDTLVKEL